MEHTPVTPSDTSSQTTPNTSSSNGAAIPSQKTSTPITEKQAPSEGQTDAADDGGKDDEGVVGAEIPGSHRGEELFLPDKKNTGDVMGHQGTLE